MTEQRIRRPYYFSRLTGEQCAPGGGMIITVTPAVAMSLLRVPPNERIRRIRRIGGGTTARTLRPLHNQRG